MLNDFQIITEESLEFLRNKSLTSPELVFQDLETLVAKFDLRLIDGHVKCDFDKQLLIPEKSTWDQNGDRENALIIYESIPGLTPVNASDERLWASLAFGPHFEYSKKRWSVDGDGPSEVLKADLKNHWFCSNARTRWKDHAVARLWWMGYLAHSCERLAPQQVFDVFFLNSDLLNSFFGHPRTVSSKRTREALLEILYTEYIEQKRYPFHRDSLRKMMKLIDLRGGKVQLDVLPVDSLLELLRSCFREAHQPNG
jgi:hypothetical protein